MSDPLAILDLPPPAARATAFGVVTGVFPLTIRVNGSTTPVDGFLKLMSYTPAVDDMTVIIRVGTDWVAIGAL
jgi:hypothetical protein